MFGDAPQNLYIFIHPDYTFEGLAAYNTFSGRFNFNGEVEMCIVKDFVRTTNACSSG
ncbi:hypothetical protein [Patiriisocius sp. Uisw_017]|jgi:hypothetical protein|uniref:hypothetical protein n=1 Tax=Patiriisocius sp. Uisw_017 TaxID=3230968 RepID=UPI0039EB9F08